MDACLCISQHLLPALQLEMRATIVSVQSNNLTANFRFRSLCGMRSPATYIHIQVYATYNRQQHLPIIDYTLP